MAWGIGNLGGGSGGGFNSHDAILRVMAPAGSTVTIVKGPYHKSDLGHENLIDHTVYDYYFVIHQSQFDSVNPWTVTATLGTQTKSDTIIIDLPDEYDIQLTYRLYLSENGTWYTNVAGNLTAVGSRTEASSGGGVARAPSISYNSGYIQVAENQSGDYYGGLAYGYNAVDISGYTTAYLRCDAWGNQKFFEIWNSRPGDPTSSHRVGHVVINGTNVTYSIDLTSLSGSLYFGVYVVKTQYSGAGINIFEMYLE